MSDILIVDDDRDWFARCEEAVSGMGFDCRLAENGLDAYALIRNRMPDVVFIGMESGLDERQVLWLLEDILPGVPVVVCSAEGDLSGGDALNAAAFLHKFAEPAEIVGTTARVLGRARGSWMTGDAFRSAGAGGPADGGDPMDSAVH